MEQEQALGQPQSPDERRIPDQRQAPDPRRAEDLDPPRPLSSHLTDLRACLIRALWGWLAATAAAYAAFPALLPRLIKPPVERLVFTSPVEPFFAQLTFAALGGVILSFPWLLAQAWRFVAPGLRPRERTVIGRVLPASCVLFAAGAALGLFVAAPLGLKFLMGYSTEFLQPYITVRSYLSFLGYLSIGLGLMFQLPVALFCLGMAGVLEPGTLPRYRKHAVVAILVLAAAVTPGPDIASQLLIALPTYALFELSILAMKLSRRP